VLLDGTWVPKNGPENIDTSRDWWTTMFHMVGADARTALPFSPSHGKAHDAPVDRQLLQDLVGLSRRARLIIDLAHAGCETQLSGVRSRLRSGGSFANCASFTVASVAEGVSLACPHCDARQGKEVRGIPPELGLTMAPKERTSWAGMVLLAGYN
jgi:hypothetical protein